MVSDSAIETPLETCWPLSGDTEFERLDLEWRATTADRIESILHTHVIDAWYPVALDPERGGFRTDLDRRWRPTGPDDRMLEYEARQTRSVARLGVAFPAQSRWIDYTRHGMRYLEEVMRDQSKGGWFWLVSRDGTPLAEGTKHAHSTAYVIGAYVAAYRLTGDRAALDIAQEAFEWLDATLHDHDHGGYYGWASRDGKVIRDRSDVQSWPRTVDPLGHEIGLKDINVHSDLCESLRMLLAERPSALLADRTRELYELVEQRFIDPGGRIHYLLAPDLTPVPSEERTGFAFQSAHRMPLLAPFVGRSTTESLQLARLLVERAVHSGWAAGSAGVYEIAASHVPHKRTWWIQTECTHALTLLAVTSGDDEYRRRIDAMLDLIEGRLLDPSHGGMYEVPTDDWSIVDRLRPTRWPKAHRWKDSSHETDMCLAMIRMLRGVPQDAPIDGTT